MPDTPLTFDFPPLTHEAWAQRLARELPAGQTAESLNWHPAGEPGVLGPYYTAADTEPLPYLHTLPDTFPYVRGHKRGTNAWRTLEPLRAEADGRAAVEAGAAALAAGAEGLELTLLAPGAFDFAYLARTLDLTKTYVGYCLPVGTDVTAFGQALVAGLAARNQPMFGLHGYTELAAPDLAMAPARDIDRLLEWGRPAADFFGLTVSGAATADAGAGPTLQLALTLSQLVTAVDEQSDRGHAPETVIGEIRVTMGAGTSYFHAIAQQRALRLLWANALLAFHVGPHHAALLKVHCRPSARIIYGPDPHTNLLRTTTAAMAAVIGGCDTLAVTAYDARQTDGPTSFGRRQARNIALLLREEARLAHAIDPAAGSWYLETLTDTMAREAWTLFQQLEAEGGYRQAHASGTVARLVEAQRQEQDELEQSGRQVRVGVNKYQPK